MNRKCPVCGSDNTEVIKSTELFEYKGRTVEVPDYLKMICHSCGESVADPASIKKGIPILRDFQRTIDNLYIS